MAKCLTVLMRVRLSPIMTTKCSPCMSATCNEKVLTTKSCQTYFHTIGVFKEDRKLRRAVKFFPSEGQKIYRGLFFNQATKTNIVHDRNFRDEGRKMLIDYLTNKAAERQRTYVLNDTNLPENAACFNLAGHTQVHLLW